jgi:hypothetical protein
MDEQDDCIEFHNIVVALSVISKAFKHFKLFVTSLPFIGFFTLFNQICKFKGGKSKVVLHPRRKRIERFLFDDLTSSLYKPMYKIV